MAYLGADKEDLDQHAVVYGQHFRYIHVGRLALVALMASPFKELKVLMAPNNNRIVYWQYEKGIRLPYDATLSVEYSRAGGTW